MSQYSLRKARSVPSSCVTWYCCGVSDFYSVNVLEDADIRQGIKEYANWPTIPQLYVNGEFVGGCDIMREMYANGELQQVLGTKPA